jgi:hypothetical protein
MKYLSPLLEQSPLNIKSQQAGFEVFVRREKYLPALKCLVAASKIDANDATVKEQTTRLRKTRKFHHSPLPASTSGCFTDKASKQCLSSRSLYRKKSRRLLMPSWPRYHRKWHVLTGSFPLDLTLMQTP